MQSAPTKVNHADPDMESSSAPLGAWTEALLAGTRRLVGFGLLVLLIGVPLLYLTHRQTERRHFRVVHDGHLYRSGAMAFTELPRFLHEYGIRAVINLRDVNGPNDPYPDPEEEQYCHEQGIPYLRLSALSWSRRPDGSLPAEQNIQKILAVCDSRENYPIWIHCFSGEHRTGIVCAVLRMEYDGWSNREAIDEMIRLGYRRFEEDSEIKDYLENYVPRSRRPSVRRGGE